MRDKPGALEYRNPDCPMCGHETWHDGDDLQCSTCHAYWPEGYDVSGDWLDSEETQCPARFRPWESSARYPDLASVEYRCVHAEDHESDTHFTAGGETWRDDTRKLA